MKHILKAALVLALTLALTGMGGVVYAKDETAAICGGSTDPPEEASGEGIVPVFQRHNSAPKK